MSQTSAINRKEINVAEKKAREASVARGDVLRSIMASPPGREWLWSQLSAMNIFSSVYSENPHRMAFLEGHRTAGLELLNDVMEFCPDQFIQAMREANGRRTAERADAERQRNTPNRDGGDSGSEAEPELELDAGSPGGYRIVERALSNGQIASE